jgi:hypothetical protein
VDTTNIVILTDGPAKNKRLVLTRTPLFLRVAISAKGTIDALDLVDDSPGETETVHVYRLDGKPAEVLYCCTEARTGRKYSRQEKLADYVYHSNQPSVDVGRDLTLWQTWCLTEQQRMKEAVL